jgi:hypothetical protein
LITFTAGIIAELAATTKHIVYGVRVNFGGGNWRFWSSGLEFEYEGNTYVPRLICDDDIPRISNWKRSGGQSDDSITLSIGNADLYCTDLYQQFSWKEARVELIRFFPDIGEGYVKFVGYGQEPEMSARSFEWELIFGLQSLRRRMLREVSAFCGNVFADPNGDCPYNPAIGYGGYETGTTPYTSCGKHKADCIARKMFGANPYASAATIARRFFTGLLMPPARTIAGNVADKRSFGRKGKAFARDVLGNESLMGKAIPVVFGNTRIPDLLKLSASFDAGRFVWALCLVSEGRCHYVHPSDVTGDDLPADDVNMASADVPPTESLMIWGANNNIASVGPYLGGDVLANGDGTYPDSEDPVAQTEINQIAGAIGQRRSLAAQRGVFQDTYLSNPYIYNTSDGDGLSLSGLCAILLRIDYDRTGKTKSEDPKVAASVMGVLCRVPKADGSVSYTANPNPIDVAFHMLINTRYGAGVSVDELDLTQWQAESDYCEESVISSQSLQVPSTGTITKAAGDWNVTLAASQKHFLFIDAITTDVNLVGATITVATAGGSVERTIASSRLEYNDRFDGDADPIPSDLWNVTGLWVEVSEVFPADKLPDAGDTYVLSGAYGNLVTRFKFDGFLSESKPAGELLQAILDNCNGTFIQAGGKIRPVIRKAVSLATVDTLPLITDKGTTPNILWRDGVTTLKVRPTKDRFNTVKIKFLDREERFLQQEYEFYDEAAQVRASTLLGEIGKRIVLPQDRDLIGTASKDQAARLATLLLRENEYVIEWEMSLQDAEELNPVEDVRRIQSDQLISTVQYVRIMEIEETSAFTAKIIGHAYFNEFYDGSGIVDFNRLLRPDNSDTVPSSIPIDVVPLLPVEIASAFTGDGVVNSGITVEFTWENPT